MAEVWKDPARPAQRSLRMQTCAVDYILSPCPWRPLSGLVHSHQLTVSSRGTSVKAERNPQVQKASPLPLEQDLAPGKGSWDSLTSSLGQIDLRLWRRSKCCFLLESWDSFLGLASLYFVQVRSQEFVAGPKQRTLYPWRVSQGVRCSPVAPQPAPVENQGWRRKEECQATGQLQRGDCCGDSDSPQSLRGLSLKAFMCSRQAGAKLYLWYLSWLGHGWRSDGW